MPVDSLVSVLGGIQAALRHLVAADVGRLGRRGRLPDAVLNTARLVLTSTRPGSFVAVMEVAPLDGAQLPLGAAEDPLTRLVTGMREPKRLPERVRQDLAEIVDRLDPGIDSIDLQSDHASARLTPNTNLVEPAEERSDVKELSLGGRLLEVNWNRMTAEIHTPEGVRRISFPEDLSSLLHRLARQVVQAVVVPPAPRSTVHQLVSLSPTISDLDFWEGRSPADLLREQEVALFDPVDLPSSEPGDETADEFLASIGR